MPTLTGHPVPATRPNRRPPGMALDGRSREYRLLVRTRAELLAMLPGPPTTILAALIEEASWATVRLAQLHATAEAGKPLTKAATKQHTGLSNIRLRALSRLADAARAGKGTRAKSDSLAAIIARHDAA